MASRIPQMPATPVLWEVINEKRGMQMLMELTNNLSLERWE